MSQDDCFEEFDMEHLQENNWSSAGKAMRPGKIGPGKIGFGKIGFSTEHRQENWGFTGMAMQPGKIGLAFWERAREELMRTNRQLAEKNKQEWRELVMGVDGEDLPRSYYLNGKEVSAGAAVRILGDDKTVLGKITSSTVAERNILRSYQKRTDGSIAEEWFKYPAGRIHRGRLEHDGLLLFLTVTWLPKDDITIRIDDEQSVKK